MDPLAPTTGGTSPDLPAWYCLRSQPKHEHIAAVHLRKHVGVNAFAPRIRFRQMRQQRKAWMTEALFPGYFFAFFTLSEQWRAVQYAHAVQGILKFGSLYAGISPLIVEQLRELVGPEELTVVHDGMPEAGQEIVIAEGPFRGLQTVVTSYLPAKERVKVLMHLLGQEMEVEVPLTSVSPVERRHPLKPRFG